MKKSKKDPKRGFDYIGVCTVFFCHDGKGNLLLHKRSKNCRDEHGCWDPGGGSLEFGEDFEQGVRREVKEEYCCDILDLKYLGAYNILRNHQNKKTHWVAVLFLAQVDPKKVKIGEPEYVDEFGWFSLDNLPSPIHSQFDRFNDMIRKELLG